MLYIWRSRPSKKGKMYHIKTPGGTLCKLQNAFSLQRYDAISETPPSDREFCSLCDDKNKKLGKNANSKGFVEKSRIAENFPNSSSLIIDFSNNWHIAITIKNGMSKIEVAEKLEDVAYHLKARDEMEKSNAD